MGIKQLNLKGHENYLLTNSCPSSSRITGNTPKKGRDADPGLVGVHPGSGVMT